MLFLLVPWTAVDLTDYFFGFVAMLLFAVLPFVTGLLGAWLGRLDLTAERAAIERSDAHLELLAAPPAADAHRPAREYGLLDGE